MRGFTITLVVMWHVSIFVLMQSGGYSINLAFALFRMPLFFFVSGFVLYKSGRKWDKTEVCQFLRKKITVQILSPILFMIVFAKVFSEDFLEMLFASSKGGYWFTFTLFEYFVIYILVQKALRLVKSKGLTKDALLLSIGLGMSAAVILANWALGAEAEMGICGLLGLPQSIYFMFFVIGSLVRKHYHKVESILDKKYTVAVLMTAFVVLVLSPGCHSLAGPLYSKTASLVGIFLVLSIFRRYRNELSKATRIGTVLQYVGRRTLDIYLLHYFFVLSNLKAIFPDFGALQSPFVELMLSFVVSVVIIACCLLVSSVLRTSPFMAHFLFGQKYAK